MSDIFTRDEWFDPVSRKKVVRSMLFHEGAVHSLQSRIDPGEDSERVYKFLEQKLAYAIAIKRGTNG